MAALFVGLFKLNTTESPSRLLISIILTREFLVSRGHVMANGTLKQTVVTVANAATLIVGRNDTRNYLCIQNVGANDINIGFEPGTVTAGNGTTLSPGGLGKQGGFFLWDGDFIPTNPIYAISAVGSTVVVLEG